MFPFSVTSSTTVAIARGQENSFVRSLAFSLELAGAEVKRRTERGLEFSGGIFSLSRSSANLFAAISEGKVSVDPASAAIVTYYLSFHQVVPLFAIFGLIVGYVAAHAFAMAAAIVLGVVAFIVPLSFYSLVNWGRFERFLARSGTSRPEQGPI